MYSNKFTYVGSPIVVDQAGVKGTPTLGFRIVPSLSGTQTAAIAYANLQVTYKRGGYQGGGFPQPSTPADQVVTVPDGSAFLIPTGSNVRITNGANGYTYDVTIFEVPGEGISTSGGAGAGGSGGGGSSSVVTATNEPGLALTAPAPVGANAGADLTGATSVQLTVFAQAGDTLLPGGNLLAWRDQWVRLPELDIDCSTIPAGQAAMTFQAISVPEGTGRVAWRPNGMLETNAGTTVDLTYQVTTPQASVQTVSSVNDPAGALGLNSATTTPPTLVTDGIPLAGINAFQVRLTAPAANTINPAGSLAAFILTKGGTIWSRAPDLDISISGLTTYTVVRQQLAFWALQNQVPDGRIAYRPSGMALTGGGTTVVVTYQPAATTTTGTSTVTNENNQALTAAAPTLSSDGASIATAKALRVTVKSHDGVSTINAAGSLAAYEYVSNGSTSTWSRAPNLDLRILLAGQTSLTFGDQSVLVPSGRIAYRPSGMALTGVGVYVDVVYEIA